jgi:hypothetical protein
MSTTNGSACDVDRDLDVLYSYFPGSTPTPAPLPEAAFSLTLKGHLAGVDALLTVRGQTPESFTRHLEAVRGLLDPVQPQSTGVETGLAPGDPGSSPGLAPGSTRGQVLPRCPDPHHGYLRKGKGGSLYCPMKLADGSWCKGGRA